MPFSMTLRILSALLAPLAGPYRVVAHGLFSFGNKAIGALTWLGVAVGYPYFFFKYGSLEAGWGFLKSWFALVLATLLQMFARWIGERPRLDPCVSHAWAGRTEPAFALALSGMAQAYAGTGRFFLAGYACSLAQVQIARLARRLESLTREDCERLSARVNTLGRALTPALGLGSDVARRLKARRGPEEIGGLPVLPMGGGGSGGPGVGFFGGVSRHVVSSLLLHGAFGVVGIFGILKYGAYLLALPLVLIGGDARLPGAAEAEAGSYFQRARDAFGQKKEDLGRRIDEGKAGLPDKLEAGKEKLGEGLDGARDEAGRQARKAFWGGLW